MKWLCWLINLQRLAVVSLLVAPFTFCFARQAEPPVDAHGRVVFDRGGNPVFYAQPGEPEGARLKGAGGGGFLSKADFSNVPQTLAGISVQETGSSWIFGVFGTQIGAAGVVPFQGDNGLELVVAATSWSEFGGNDFWYVLQHNPASTNFEQTFVHPPYSPANYWNSARIVRMMAANVTGSTASELVVALSDGRVFLYDLATKSELAQVYASFEIDGFSTADLDGDGLGEMLVLNDEGLSVYKVSGGRVWHVPGVTGTDLVVAQMDGDPGFEIATASGHVVDVSSCSIQWTSSTSFQGHLRAADIDADGMDELIAANWWYSIAAYDVDTQTNKWTYNVSRDIGSIELADVAGDSALELLYADNQFGSIHALSLAASAPVELWKVTNPDSGVSRIVVADMDNDGETELVWGSGSNISSGDYLNVMDLASRTIEWRSVPLSGPFVTPVLGDLDGDGTNELVTGSWESDSGYDSGRILVFDPQTFRLIGMSPPICQNRSWTGLRDLKLRDIDQDGRTEILVAADSIYDGRIEIYNFDSGVFTLKWVTPNQPVGAPYSQVEVADVDGDGDMEIIAGNDSAHSASSGTHLEILDYPSGAQLWRSFHLGGYWHGVSSLRVQDLDNDGQVDACLTVSGVGSFVFDLQEGVQVFRFEGDHRSVTTVPGSTGFYIGSGAGSIFHVIPNGTNNYKSYVVDESWSVTTRPIIALAPGPDSSFLISTDNGVFLWPETGAPNSSAAEFTGNVGAVSWVVDASGLRTFAALSYGIGAFAVVPRTNMPVIVAMDQSNGWFSEDAAETTVSFQCSSNHPSLEVYFDLSGTAIPGADYEIFGATHVDGSLWMTTIPADHSTVDVRFVSVPDDLTEGNEYFLLNLRSTDRYKVGSSSTHRFNIIDSVVEVSVRASDFYARELRTRRKVDRGVFTFTRTKDFSKPLIVNFAVEGAARNGIDYRKIGSRITFRAGESTVTLPIIPFADRVAEGDEDVGISIRSGDGYQIGNGYSYADLTILDGEPTISMSEGGMLRKRPYVQLVRDGGRRDSLMLELIVARETVDGEVKVWTERVAFPGKRDSIQHLIRGNWAKASTVRIWMVPQRHFQRGTSFLEFETPALGR